MTARIEVYATGSNKCVRLTDLLSGAHLAPDTCQAVGGGPREENVSTYGNAPDTNFGYIKIEVARDLAGPYAIHAAQKKVVEDEKIPVDDSHLPPSGTGTADKPQEKENPRSSAA